MSITTALVLIVVDVLYVVASSIAIGFWAPHWPPRWLQSDPFPLRRMPWETPALYRRIGVAWLARRLPEGGAAFGGQSKSSLPGTHRDHLAAYLVEVRRAEWVHWLSTLAAVLLFAFNPWWLALAFVAVVALANVLFILVLRNNRFRLERILER